MLETADFVVIGCGPAGATAAREAARSGVDTVVLEKDRVVGEKRVCAAGLRPGFCGEFDLPESLIHCTTPRLALFDAAGREHELFFGPGHTTTREELDGTMARMAASAGASIRTGSLFRSVTSAGDRCVVEYADAAGVGRRHIAARNVFFAQGATAQLESGENFSFDGWQRGLMTTLQHRVYLERPATAIAYKTLELHYYRGCDGRQIVAWMFPKRDHLAIGLGFIGKMPGAALRGELADFTSRVSRRLYPDVRVTAVKTEGHLLYGGWPRPRVGGARTMVGGTAAGLVDATNGEGIYEAALSGRFAAEAVAESPNAEGAPARYARRLRARLHGRLSHRAALMQYLQSKPRRYGMLFEQLAATPRFARLLEREDCERDSGDRLYLIAQALRFFARSALA